MLGRHRTRCESYATLHVRPAVSIRGLKAAEVDERVQGLDEVAIDGYGRAQIL